MSGGTHRLSAPPPPYALFGVQGKILLLSLPSHLMLK
jgi:hypothetical protein